VPVHLTGEAAPGTLVLHELNTLAVEVDALAIPDRIEVSIDGAEAGSQVLAGQVTLPAGATLVTDPEAMIVAVQVAPTAEALEGETEATAAAEEPEEAPAAAEDE